MGKEKTKRSRSKGPKSAGAFVQDGECWAIPLPRMGFCPLVVARAPAENADPSFVYVYVKVASSADLPRPEEVGGAESWDCAWVGLIASKPFREARWKRIGVLPGFDRAEWPVAPVRESCVDESKPINEWGKYPWGEMWCIQTTLDEPSLTVISNVAATRDEALRFPAFEPVSWASSFEKALIKHFKKIRPGFWDLELTLRRIAPGSVQYWRAYADRVRGAWAPDSVRWLPAGKKTDRELRAGTWMGLPLTGGGFGAALLIAKPEPHQRFWSDAVVMTMRRSWDRWPNLEDVVTLRPEDGAEIAQTTMICVRDGRWRVLGMHPGFDPDEWVWPIPWSAPDSKAAMRPVEVRVSLDESAKIRVPAEILELDPEAGQRCNGTSSPLSMECGVLRIIDGTDPTQVGVSKMTNCLVTPHRLAAWRAINTAIRQALQRPASKT